MRWLRLGLVVLALVFGTTQYTLGTDKTVWPKAPVTITVPFSAGGGSDLLARGLAKALQDELGTPFKVENRPGAGGITGLATFLQQPGDGRHIALMLQVHLSTGILRGAPYDIDSFRYLCSINESPMAVVVSPTSPWASLSQLVKHIRENPGQVRWGVTVGSTPHLAAAIMADELGLDVRTVCFNDGTELRAALLGGHVDVISVDVEGSLALASKLKFLGVFAAKPYPLLPEVPTVSDALGVKIPSVANYRFIIARADMDPRLAEEISRALEKVITGGGFGAWAQTNGVTIAWEGPDATEHRVRELDALVKKYASIFR